jgi:hypothetical protein
MPKAHAHALAASRETKISARSAAGGSEHILAAGEFSNAAKATGDIEVRASILVSGRIYSKDPRL